MRASRVGGGFCGQRHNVGRAVRLNVKPGFALGFGRQPFVMLMNHGRGIPRLCGGQVFVGVQDKVKRAKRVAQPVVFALHASGLAHFCATGMEAVFRQLPESAGVIPVRPQPFGQGRADRHEAARAGLALGLRDFDMALNSPNILPFQAQELAVLSPHSPPMAISGFNGVFRRFQQGAEFLGSVNADVAVVGVFHAHRVGFQEAVGRRQVVVAHAPLDELFDASAVVIAGLWAGVGHCLNEGVQVLLGQVADGMAGECFDKPAQTQRPDARVFG